MHLLQFLSHEDLCSASITASSIFLRKTGPLSPQKRDLAAGVRVVEMLLMSSRNMSLTPFVCGVMAHALDILREEQDREFLFWVVRRLSLLKKVSEQLKRLFYLSLLMFYEQIPPLVGFPSHTTLSASMKLKYCSQVYRSRILDVLLRELKDTSTASQALPIVFSIMHRFVSMGNYRMNFLDNRIEYKNMHSQLANCVITFTRPLCVNIIEISLMEALTLNSSQETLDMVLDYLFRVYMDNITVLSARDTTFVQNCTLRLLTTAGSFSVSRFFLDRNLLGEFSEFMHNTALSDFEFAGSLCLLHKIAQCSCQNNNMNGPCFEKCMQYLLGVLTENRHSEFAAGVVDVIEIILTSRSRSIDPGIINSYVAVFTRDDSDKALSVQRRLFMLDLLMCRHRVSMNHWCYDRMFTYASQHMITADIRANEACVGIVRSSMHAVSTQFVRTLVASVPGLVSQIKLSGVREEHVKNIIYIFRFIIARLHSDRKDVGEHLRSSGFFVHVCSYMSRRMDLSSGMYRKMDFVFFRLVDCLISHGMLDVSVNSSFLRYCVYMLLSNRNNVKVCTDVVKVLHKHASMSLGDLKEAHILRTQGAPNAMAEIVSVLTSPERTNSILKLWGWRVLEVLLRQNDRQCFCCGAVSILLGMDSAECDMVISAAMRDIIFVLNNNNVSGALFVRGNLDILRLAATCLQNITANTSSHTKHSNVSVESARGFVSAIASILPKMEPFAGYTEDRNALLNLSRTFQQKYLQEQ